nr:beta-galactosidase [Acetatifactor muris]
MEIDFTKSQPREAEVIQVTEHSMKVCLEKSGGGITLEGIQNAGRRYLTGYITILEEHSLPLTLRFLGQEGEEKVHIRFTLLPRFRTKVYFDFQWLDLNRGAFAKTPGALKKVIYGTRTGLTDVGRVELGVKPVFHDVRILLEDFVLTEEEPVDFPLPPERKLVDRFGQYTEKDWPGKIRDEAQLALVMHENQGEAAYPVAFWNHWGGDAGRKLQERTGFFATCKTPDGRWHLTDPDGCDYFSMGICCTGIRCMGDITGVKSLLEQSPEETSELKQFYRQERHPWFGTPVEQFDYLGANLYRVYGEDWKEKGEALAYHILMSNGINSQGNGPGLNVNDGKSRLPYTRQLPEFPSTAVNIFRDFPDVLSPEYEESSVKCAEILKEWKDDPWMIGYFLRNEPQFHFVAGVSLGNEVLHNPVDTYCRRGLIAFLRERYKNVERLNQAWGCAFESFEELRKPVENCIQTYPKSAKDLREYSIFLVREYCRIPSQACKKVDPNHLILGMRWSKMNHPDMLAGWEYMDVFSFNCYALEPLTDLNFVQASGVDRPVIIGEYHAGALDRGLTATGIKGVANQNERGVLWREFVEGCAAHPLGVGAHWFEFVDEFVLGRFDGENYQIGMVDICMQPYKELTWAVRETAEVLYDVKNGEKEAFDRMPEMIPMIG